MDHVRLKDGIKRIYGIVFSMISISVLVAVFMIVYENTQKFIGKQQQYEKIYVQMVEDQLSAAERFIYNLVANNTNYVASRSKNEQKRTLALSNIKTYMGNETFPYERIYYYFIYDKELDTWVSKTGINGNGGETPYLKKYIKETINKEELACANWMLCRIRGNYYLMYVYQDESSYIGAIADIAYLVQDIKRMTDNIVFLYGNDMCTSENIQPSDLKQPAGWIMNDGKIYYSFCSKLARTEVYLITYCNLGNLLAGSFWIVFILVLLCITAIVPAIILQNHLNKEVIVPIGKIADNMEKIKLGADLIELEEVESKYEEMDALNRMFKDMLSKIYLLEQVKLDYLHLQANPHFLLNGLNTLHALLERKKEADLTEYVMMLVRHMRFMIHLKEKTIPLSSEISFTKNYIALYERRVSFSIILEMEGEKEWGDVQVLPYSIQTFVENCVKYGMSQDGIVHILIQIARQNEKTVIKISDQGKGFGKQTIEEIRQGNRLIDEYGREHIGIYFLKIKAGNGIRK